MIYTLAARTDRGQLDVLDRLDECLAEALGSAHAAQVATVAVDPDAWGLTAADEARLTGATQRKRKGSL